MVSCLYGGICSSTARASLTASSAVLERPSPFLSTAQVLITGQFNLLLNVFSSILIPLLLQISSLLRATTTGIPSSRSCVVRKRLLFKLVASTIFMIASGCLSLIYPLLMLSSGVKVDNEYAPGKSTAVTVNPPL